VSGDTPLTIPTLKAQALFYYLIATRQPHSREKLATLFWGDTPEPQAKGSLRQALYELRRTLGPEDPSSPGYILADGGVLSFNTDSDYWLDVEEFERRVPGAETSGLEARAQREPDIEDLRQAIELYTGNFLEGFTLKDSYEFDDWSFFERDRLQRAYLGALSTLSDYHAARGEYELAISHAARILTYDSLQESVHRQLMRLYYAAGNRSAALKQYEICKEILARELGVPPLAETTTLYEQILQEKVVISPPSPRPQPATTPRPPAPTPRALLRRPLPAYLHSRMVGREQEWLQLKGYLDEVFQGRGMVVFIEGEVGIGKTRLVQEVMQPLETQVHFLAGRCYEAEMTQPYQPLVDALRSYLPQVAVTELEVPALWLREVSRLVPELAVTLPDLPVNVPLDPAQERSRLFEGVAQFLMGLSQQRPTILFLDDLHWADDSTLALLQYLARATAQSRVLLLGAFRSEEALNSLRQVVRALSQEGFLRCIVLKRLSLPELTAMIRDMAGMREGGERFSQRLYQETAGNPFFTIEVIRSLFEQGVLHQEPGGWTTAWEDFTTNYAQIPIPPSLRQVIQARLERLSDAARQILEVAAVTRHQFYFSTVREASGQPEAVALDSLDQLLQAQLIREVSVSQAGSQYDFTHELIREVAYQGLSGARRQHLHCRVAETLEREHAEELEEVVDQLAYHYLQGGQREKALTYNLLAADKARRVYANDKAVEHYQRALELAREPVTRSTILEHMGDVYTLMGKHERAIASYKAVLESGLPSGNGRQGAEIHRKIARVYERGGDYDRALEHLETGKRLLAADDECLEMARLDDGIALVYIRQGRYAEAVELCRNNLERIATLPSETDTRLERAWLYNTLGSAYLHQSQYDLAIEHFQRSLALREELGDTQGVATLYNNLGVVHYYRGDYEAARQCYQQSFDSKREIGNIYGLAISATNLALMTHHLGDDQRALELIEQALGICKDIEAEWLLPEAYRVLAEIYLAQGRHEQALDSAQQALEKARAIRNCTLEGVALRTLGKVTALGKGEWEVAAEHFARSIAIFQDLGDSHELAKTLYAHGLALQAEGRGEEARAQLQQAAEIFARSGASGRLKRALEAQASVQVPQPIRNKEGVSDRP